MNNFLQGKRVLITREKTQADELSEKIAAVGGIPIVVPLLAFQTVKPAIDLSQVNRYDWLVFTSKNGIEFFLKQFNEELDSRVKIAVIGKKTAEVAERYGLKISFMPPAFVAESFVQSFLKVVHPNERVLVCKGNLARDVIARGLAEKGIAVDEAIVYETVLPTEAEEELVAALSEKMDIVLFTSPSTIEHFVKIVKANRLIHQVQKAKFVTIGPITKKKAERMGLRVALSPKRFTVDDMLLELQEMLEGRLK